MNNSLLMTRIITNILWPTQNSMTTNSDACQIIITN